MREILFRGKSTDNGEWYEGYYTLYGKSVGVAPCILTGTEKGCVIPQFVAADTVGQYTGLTDKNGKKIFEGDIVRHYNMDELPEEFEIGKIFFSEEQCCFKRTCNQGFSSCYISADCKYEVIGNIHDNPELLEVED